MCVVCYVRGVCVCVLCVVCVCVLCVLCMCCVLCVLCVLCVMCVGRVVCVLCSRNLFLLLAACFKHWEQGRIPKSGASGGPPWGDTIRWPPGGGGHSVLDPDHSSSQFSQFSTPYIPLNRPRTFRRAPRTIPQILSLFCGNSLF